MFAKKYIVEAVGTTVLTLTIILINNPLATAFLWASLLVIRKNQEHCYFNLAITCSFYAARYLSLKEALHFGFYQIIGSFLGLVCFKYISGSYFTPDTTIINSFSLLSIFEAVSTALLCLTALAIYEPAKDKKNGTIIHNAIIHAITLIGLQTIGSIVYPSFGIAVLLSTFLDMNNESFRTQLQTNIHYSLIYFIIPIAIGLASYQLKKWLDDGEVKTYDN